MRSKNLLALGGRLLKSGHRLRVTGAGLGYFAAWLLLLLAGWHQQLNLLLMTAGLAAGPIVASFAISGRTLRRVRFSRRTPGFVFAGRPLAIHYDLENRRTLAAVLAMEVVDELQPVDRTIPGAIRLEPRIVFDRVPPRRRGHVRWASVAPARGEYRFTNSALITRAPFGFLERSETVSTPGGLIIYPDVARLARRWRRFDREATESRKGSRHDRTAQQQEYHGMRDYRAGDSLRWIHWRTTARLGRPMVKEFEQQGQQGLAVLLDPWLPRSRISSEHREALERVVRFAASVCYDTCRQQGRRLLLGWTGAVPEVRHGPSSTRLLHELLGALATLRGSSEGQLAMLCESMPPAILREARIVVVSTRPVSLMDQSTRSPRLAQAMARGLGNRLIVLDASRGEIEPLLEGPADDPVRIDAQVEYREGIPEPRQSAESSP